MDKVSLPRVSKDGKITSSLEPCKQNVLTKDDRFNIESIQATQGIGMSLRYANEIRAAQQVKRLPFLKSSNLQEEVLRDKLCSGLDQVYADMQSEEEGLRRVMFM